MRWAWVWVGVCVALATPAWAHRARADPCGCHHQYGLRHCHPTRTTDRCAAPAKGTAPAQPKPSRRPSRQ